MVSGVFEEEKKDFDEIVNAGLSISEKEGELAEHIKKLELFFKVKEEGSNNIRRRLVNLKDKLLWYNNVLLRFKGKSTKFYDFEFNNDFPLETIIDKISEINQNLTDLFHMPLVVSKKGKDVDHISNEVNLALTALDDLFKSTFKKMSEFILLFSTEPDQFSELLKEAENNVEQTRTAVNTAKSIVSIKAVDKYKAEVEKEIGKYIPKIWLLCTIALFLMTLYSPIFSEFLVEKYYKDSYPVNQVLILSISLKVTLVVLLATATLWVGKMYKTISHQNELLKNKVLSLGAFSSLVSSDANDDVKSQILIEATKSIFRSDSTGYIGDNETAMIIQNIASTIKPK
ncbi:hypothetical protein [Piscirickettsia salmonis]|nr:hypothetical protein [Piscirickettsia salmonis]ERL60600.1 hypothetical protein K661_03078 [Piscirickettsia salmonis LF-89 = ATCC VR-1361]QGN79234.1 hypothetical protein Psal001_03499 [Piscirickettsia salmonis]QGN82825.1 hypothetical protein Psal002_03525 [Piscirickettsia salmonis]QGN86337.1 hypothetical protein Psal003_03446 [Piscirickettsia salmonis]QGN89841.1 hypothetical protein Psal004_03436 [Piscirickettsia salmonis]